MSALLELLVDVIANLLVGWVPGGPLWWRRTVQAFWVALLLAVAAVAVFGFISLGRSLASGAT